MMKSMWFWAAAGFAAVLAVSVVPVVGIVALSPLASLIVGVAAAWYLRATTKGTRAGVVAGVGALVATTIAFTAVGLLLGSDPTVQEFVRSSEPHPEARIPYAWMPGLGIAAGALGGFGIGLVNFALSMVGALVTTIVAGHRPSQSLNKASS